MRQPRAKKRSPAQIAAAQKWAAAGRKAAATARAKRGNRPTRAQHQAALKWAAAGRAAQAAKRQHKAFHPAKKRAAPAPGLFIPGPTWLAGDNGVLPSCAVTALANHLFATRGARAGPAELRALHELTADGDSGCLIGDTLEAATGHSLAGFRLAEFWRCDPGDPAAGMIAGISIPAPHAVLLTPAGIVSWGQELCWRGTVEEAWAARWARWPP